MSPLMCYKVTKEVIQELHDGATRTMTTTKWVKTPICTFCPKNCSQGHPLLLAKLVLGGGGAGGILL